MPKLTMEKETYEIEVARVKAELEVVMKHFLDWPSPDHYSTLEDTMLRYQDLRVNTTVKK